ncbi:trypsin-like serine protease [Streptomyces sp. NBC_00237]|uniref:trypsin-like serine peptidase n=1 Tax=Streptomyces sp. NBC_00237 TaxID=2975687 RepID=UPI0022596478|nr:trypsin-like serine protease [Streptomyces sp. NBC_00237]MCX5201641.1 trypsin-like serine protease [Streptomyces sp. NBC_00237]
MREQWMSRSRSVAVAGSLALMTLVSACGGPVASAPRLDPGTSPVPQKSAAVIDYPPFIGVLVDGKEHWCTASVVDSPKGNIVATAAHCVYEVDSSEPRTISFAPGFSGQGAGKQPYGSWKVRSVQVDERWQEQEDDPYDFAFLALEPDEQGRNVQEVVGAAGLDWESGTERQVTVVGYPDPDHNPDNRPVTCTTDSTADKDLPGMVRMECAGFWNGTSGSPWLTGYRGPDRPGRLIGVLSGGDTDAESTAALFGPPAKALYQRALKE